MGFRSTFITEDYHGQWPDWFRDKYAELAHFPDADHGPIASKGEGKTHDRWAELPSDIQRAIDWSTRNGAPFVLVYLHECGGISRVHIEKDGIFVSEPLVWSRSSSGNLDLTHYYCGDCTDSTEPKP